MTKKIKKGWGWGIIKTKKPLKIKSQKTRLMRR